MRTTLLLLALCTLLHARSHALDGVAVRVNGELILISQVAARTAPQERTLRDTLKGKDLVDAVRKLRKSQLEQMIDRQLLLQELKRQGSPLPAHATDEQIDATIKDRFHSDRQQWRKRLRRSAVIETY